MGLALVSVERMHEQMFAILRPRDLSLVSVIFHDLPSPLRDAKQP